MIEFTRGATKVSDYCGYFYGKTYYINKIKGGYVASAGGINCPRFTARTLKELSTQLAEVSK